MKIVSLNCWGGNRKDALLKWLTQMRDTVDMFCLQEVYTSMGGLAQSDLFDDIQNTLGSDFMGWFSPGQRGLYANHMVKANPNIDTGLAIFIRSSMAKVLDFQQSFIVGHRNMLTVEEVSDSDYTAYADRLPRALQILHFEHGDGVHWVIGNYHGIWQSHGKGDSPERLSQSRRLVEKLRHIKRTFRSYDMHEDAYKIVLCGDFNLTPDTKAFRLIEDNRVIKFNELVTLNNIESTRTSLYKKSCKFADYMFVSRSVDLGGLEVPDIPISDHRPLIAGLK